MNLWVLRRHHAGVRIFQRRKPLPIQACRIDTLVRRQITREFAQSLAKLTACAYMVAALAVIAADRQVNEGLKKHSARSPLGRPCRFENLVAGKELAIVEEIDAVL